MKSGFCSMSCTAVAQLRAHFRTVSLKGQSQAGWEGLEVEGEQQGPRLPTDFQSQPCPQHPACLAWASRRLSSPHPRPLSLQRPLASLLSIHFKTLSQGGRVGVGKESCQFYRSGNGGPTPWKSLTLRVRLPLAPAPARIL